MQGHQGASEALDKLIYEAHVPMRLAHHELGALYAPSWTAASSPDLAARLSEQTERSIKIDNVEMAAILRGEIVPDTALNIPAVHEAFARVGNAIAREKTRIGATSEVERAIAALLEEVETFIA